MLYTLFLWNHRKYTPLLPVQIKKINITSERKTKGTRFCFKGRWLVIATSLLYKTGPTLTATSSNLQLVQKKQLQQFWLFCNHWKKMGTGTWHSAFAQSIFFPVPAQNEHFVFHGPQCFLLRFNWVLLPDIFIWTLMCVALPLPKWPAPEILVKIHCQSAVALVLLVHGSQSVHTRWIQVSLHVTPLHITRLLYRPPNITSFLLTDHTFVLSHSWQITPFCWHIIEFLC